MLEITSLAEFPEILEKIVTALIKQKNLKKESVFLKPNMGYPKTAPFTTSKEIILKTVKEMKKIGFEKVFIGEGSTSKNSSLENFKSNNIYNALSDDEVIFIDLAKEEAEKINIGIKKYHYLPKILKNMDFRISMPVIKMYSDDNGEYFLSNALKNNFGLPPKEPYKASKESYMRDKLHNNLHQSIVELHYCVEKYAPFHLYISDGIQILNGFAAKGKTVSWGKIILATNPIKADTFIVEQFNKPIPRFLKLLQHEDE
ncbi:MAG: DUF362 domain-containing protein [Asgard group archaeon]|nr:DUF362 domain-containing protein [Asgard group archaeon]